MFGNVLIGVDGREGGWDALALARRLAAPEATFILGHVYGPPVGAVTADAGRGRQAHAEELLEHERELGDIDAALIAHPGHRVGDGLHRMVEECHADLLVVGSTRHALLGHVLVGDDCRAALQGATCAVAVAPHGYHQASREPRRLGVGYDGSAEGDRALLTAQELAGRYGGAVTAVWTVTFEDVRRQDPVPVGWPTATQTLIDQRSRRLAELQDGTAVVAYGGPREDLVKVSRELDLLIVGSRGYGPVGRITHGSVSRYLLGHVGCPLVVIPHRGVEQPAAAPA